MIYFLAPNAEQHKHLSLITNVQNKQIYDVNKKYFCSVLETIDIANCTVN